MKLKEPPKYMRALASTNESLYLNVLRDFGIEPNFWCSLEYFAKAGYYEITDDRLVGIFDNEDQAILPLIDRYIGHIHSYIPEGGIWADLVAFAPKFRSDVDLRKTFLDYQYVYDPQAFLHMEGKQWATFRKNSRKFPRRFGSDRLFLSSNVDINRLEVFSTNSLKILRSEVIHDFDVMMKYLFFGKNRLFILDWCSDRILGVNIWDENHQYINYRYCLCVDEPFLSEYVRLAFYEYIAKINKHTEHPKLVNDGGVMDRPGLKKFKDKLNPVTISKIHSWK